MSEFQRMANPPVNLLAQLAQSVGTENLLTDPTELEAYAWDNTGIRARPDAVVLAACQDHVIATLKACSRVGVPVIARGAGTGNVGGALAAHGGVILSTQRMNRIMEISLDDRLAVVEPGVVNGDLQHALAEKGLFWPPDPSSSQSCSIGGNIAMCAAGPNAIRYGVTRDWVLGLTAVLADGSVIRTGGRVTKGVVGYDLTRLLVGSEGSLAVVTQAVLKLAPKPQARRLLSAAFASVAEAAQATSMLMSQGTPPSAIEFLDPSALDLLRREEVVELPDAARALLLLEVSGDHDDVERQADAVVARLEPVQPVELARANNNSEAKRIWAARNALSPALKRLSPKRVNEDVVVPVSRLAALIDGCEVISAELDLPMVNFGHAGNGNIHVNFLVDPSDDTSMEKIKPALDQLFRLVLDLGGTLSGEHGVGTQKRPYVGWELDETTLDLQRRLKLLFDPTNTLNPGKIFPEQGADFLRPG
ncbi:MAG: FAD-binding protein [Magnetococcales bacterium]|nr:FAD-binding protein [Magnetococcales bacterium]